ncbi:MAG TPA: hypothetical protein DEQ40_20975 [Oxalobacteraceae bacterium]|nr:hypothetical protein [Oxalobacteraceae bacterium]
MDAAVGSNIAANAATNNYLKHGEILDITKARKECNGGRGSSAACGEVTRLETLDKQRDATLAACDGDNSVRCTGVRQEVRTAYADIIRKSDDQFGVFALRPIGYNEEALKTQGQADNTISSIDRVKGIGTGLASAIIGGIADAAKGGVIYVKAVAGNVEAGDQLGKAVDGVISIASSPELWGKILTNATKEQHDKIADAYEKGDGVALGKIVGEVLSNFVGGGAGTVSKVGKAATVAEDLSKVAKDVEKAADAAKEGASGVEVNLSLLDGKATTHILDGDSLTSGGHRYGTGSPGKSEFPQSWSDQKISNTVSDIATDPSVTWTKADARGYITTTAMRDGVDVKVVYDTKNDRIVTGYPSNLSKNPKK